jgi:hypothetical protein
VEVKMASTSTKTATAGKFQSRGEDFVQYVDAKGNMLSRVDGDGVSYSVDFQTSAGVSLNALQQQVDNIPIGTDIDGGTF